MQAVPKQRVARRRTRSTLRRPTVWLGLLAIVAATVAVMPTMRSAEAAVSPGSCEARRNGVQVTLEWADNGAEFVVRRNGQWLATPGTRVTTYTDSNAPSGATYEVKAWKAGGVSTWPCSVPVAVSTCTVAPTGAGNVLKWVDDGSTFVIRRDGIWLATPGVRTTQYTDALGSASSRYELIGWKGASSTQQTCAPLSTAPQQPPPTQPPPASQPPTSQPPSQVPRVDRVIHVSIDALRSDHINQQLTPNLVALRAQSASTLNARTDADVTKTLPNHTSQWTGRSVFGASGHQLAVNQDDGSTVHAVAGRYVASIFDVVHDNGARTALFASKDKFDLLDRSWNGTNGAVDVTGADNGRDKIDIYSRADTEANFNSLAYALQTRPSLKFVAFHIPYPDSAGHEAGWTGAGYDAAVSRSDALLGRVVQLIKSNPTWATSTMIVVTADHGGPNSGLLHDDQLQVENFTVPFVVWGPGIVSADLYAINVGRRFDPGATNPMTITARLPIRTHEVANLALEALGYGPVPGSLSNADQSLAVRAP